MTILAQEGVFSWALQYSKYGTGTLAATNAYGRYTRTVQPSDGDHVVVGATTYIWKTALTPAAGEVLIGASLTASMKNLQDAIMGITGSGTEWAAATTHPNASVTAVSAFYTLFLTVIATGSGGNSTVLTATGTGYTLIAFTGGFTAGAFDFSLLSYHRHRANDIDFDVVQDDRIFPLEVGSVITPTGAYRAGAYVAGGATLLPRLQDTFGELLLGLLGYASKADNSPVAGAYTHDFQIDPNNPATIPWFTIHKLIPGRDSVRPEGNIGVDCKLAQMQIMIPQNDIVSVRCDFAGRIPQFDNYPDAWLWANAYENAGKVPVSCKGDFKIPGTPSIYGGASLPVTSVVVTIVNNLTTPRQEMVVGAYNPDDFAVISRVMTVRYVFKWSDPTLYQLLYTGAANGTAWTPTPFTTVWDGGSNYAFQADVQAVDNVTGTTPFQLTIRAGTVVWKPNGPIVLRGGGILQMEVLGTVLDPAPLVVPYAEVLLVNGRSTVYAVPAAP